MKEKLLQPVRIGVSRVSSEAGGSKNFGQRGLENKIHQTSCKVASNVTSTVF